MIDQDRSKRSPRRINRIVTKIKKTDIMTMTGTKRSKRRNTKKIIRALVQETNTLKDRKDTMVYDF